MIGDSPAKLAFQGAKSRFLVDRRPGPFLRDFDLVLFLLGRVPMPRVVKTHPCQDLMIAERTFIDSRNIPWPFSVDVPFWSLRTGQCHRVVPALR